MTVTRTRLTADRIVSLLGLVPLEGEGGLYRENWRLAGPDGAARATAIYYFLTPDIFSEIHRLPNARLYHFYLGDPVDLLLLHPDGSVQWQTLGQDIEAGMGMQFLVPGGTWQGSRLRDGGEFALMGTTMTPGFDFATYERGERDELEPAYPEAADTIRLLTRA